MTYIFHTRPTPFVQASLAQAGVLTDCRDWREQGERHVAAALDELRQDGDMLSKRCMVFLGEWLRGLT